MTDVALLAADLAKVLARQTEHAADDPFTNPILMTALEISRRMDRGEIDLAALDGVVGRLTADAFCARAQRMARRMGPTDPVEIERETLRLIDKAAGIDPAGPYDDAAFARYQAVVERESFGVVLTGHPTFALTRPLTRALARLAAGRDDSGAPLTETALAALRATAEGESHLPEPTLTLDLEIDWSLEALSCAQDALHRLHRAVLDQARTRWPARWRELSPRLATAATWLGFDHDGRSDISWADALRARLLLKRRQAEDLARRVGALAQTAPATAQPLLAVAESLLTLAARRTAELARLAEAARRPGGTVDLAGAKAFARALVDGRSEAPNETARLRALLLHAAEACGDAPEAAAAAAVASGLALHGLASAHVHFRLNASQIHNAVRRLVGLESSPDDPVFRRSYMKMLSEKLATATPRSVNLGVLMEETSSGRRMMAMIAQIAKHIDGEAPVRFLIAETEHAFTLPAALLLAKLLGVDDRIDISPLFETAAGMEHGADIIEEALRDPVYRDYIQRRGRLCVQFGYSDSGRYMGQTAATFHIERLRGRLAKSLSDAGLHGVTVVLFDTHGESVGRGGHPGALEERFRYLSPSGGRNAFAQVGLTLKEEASFQGGDGFAWFMTTPGALAVFRAGLAAALDDAGEHEDDPVYDDRLYAAEFFASIRHSFEALVADPNYAALLSAFGADALPRAGSRPSRRQHEGWRRGDDFGHPSQTRAIPNNAVLHLLSCPAVAAHGVGAAAARDLERFRLMLAQSPRFRRAVDLAAFALSWGDLDCLRAYVATLDPGMWLDRSAHARDPQRRDELRDVAAALDQMGIGARLDAAFRRLQSDQLLLEDALIGSNNALSTPLAPQQRDSLRLLHALRIVLAHRIALLAVRLPDFSAQMETSRDELITNILRLDVASSVVMLGDIFPRRGASLPAEEDFAEPADYRTEGAQGYEDEHERLFGPMAKLHALFLRAGAGVIHHVGAFG